MPRHFLSVKDFSAEEICAVICRAHELKALFQQRDGKSAEHLPLKGKCLAMIFQKPSNRTRISFEVGMFQLGGMALNILPGEIQMGEREPIVDIAKVISRYVDGIMLRLRSHADIVQFAENSAVPVINGLSDLHHPCQAVADILTIEEKKGCLTGLRLCYVGDGNNVCNSLIEICDLLEMEIIIACPPGYEPLAANSAARCVIEHNPEHAVANADVVYTDVWISMGQEAEAEKRVRDFGSYMVTEELLAKAKRDVILMHCLPARRGMEVDNTVLDSPRSVVFDQAENRLHAQKAILVSLL